MKKRGFTLLEMILAITVFAIIFVVLFTMFLRMIRLKSDIEARQVVVKSTYTLMEKLNTSLQNYTIDYEEYFNRSMVGCNLNPDAGVRSQGEYFTWNVNYEALPSGHCKTNTFYGNRTPMLDSAAYIDTYENHSLYACSSDAGITNPFVQPPAEERLVVSAAGGDSCASNLFAEYEGSVNFGIGERFYQPYGQYKVQFVDVKTDVDDKPGRAGDDDDTDLGQGPIAIQNATGVQELYLISKDKTKRTFFRRALVSSRDWNNNGSIDAPNERLYAIQKLQLRSFDAGNGHDFDSTTYPGVYDGKIDTRACDASAGFICKGASVGGIYADYYLPLDENDGWVNITTNDITITDWNMKITPTKDPDLAWGEDLQQRNPFITLYIKTTIYGTNRSSKLNTNNLDNVTFDLQTSFNIKTNY